MKAEISNFGRYFLQGEFYVAIRGKDQIQIYDYFVSSCVFIVDLDSLDPRRDTPWKKIVKMLEVIEKLLWFNKIFEVFLLT